MTEFESTVIGNSVIPSLIITVILMLGFLSYFSSIGVRTISNRQKSAG